MQNINFSNEHSVFFWETSRVGYYPSILPIHRFSWFNNLLSGSKKSNWLELTSICAYKFKIPYSLLSIKQKIWKTYKNKPNWKNHPTHKMVSENPNDNIWYINYDSVQTIRWCSDVVWETRAPTPTIASFHIIFNSSKTCEYVTICIWNGWSEQAFSICLKPNVGQVGKTKTSWIFQVMSYQS